MTLIVIAIILYLRSPESAWAYALLKYALIFLAGTLFPVVVLFVIGMARTYRKRIQEKKKALKYVSTEKAWVDYHADLGPAFTELQTLMTEIGRATISVGEQSGELIRAIQIQDPRRRKQMVSRGAAALNKHCQKMERASGRLASVSKEALDAGEGVLKSTPSASEGNRDALIGLDEALKEVIDSGAVVIENQKELIETSKAVYGQVSMDVNTSMNWLIAVCEENIRIMEAFYRGMSQSLMPELQRKLNS